MSELVIHADGVELATQSGMSLTAWALLFAFAPPAFRRWFLLMMLPQRIGLRWPRGELESS
jgi:hypothetical protein